MKKKHRFWSSTTNEHREIISMAKNEYGDFIFTLDGGEIWQFTPHKKIDALEVERMYCMGRGRDSKTGAPSVLSFVVLKNPKESFTGNIRILPRQPEPTPPKKARKRGGVTQKEAAALIGVSVSTIRAWERGERTPEGYPGLADAVLLKAFAGRREQGKRMKTAVLGATRHGDMDAVSHRVERGRRW